MSMPSIFDYFRDERGARQDDCWAIFGKDADSWAEYSAFPSYGDRFQPKFDPGIGESSTEDDQKVFRRVMDAMEQRGPSLIFVDFGYTDQSAHNGDFELHKKAIKNVDAIITGLWKEVQSNSRYKDRTTLILVTDYGRHDDQHGGFANHGDNCEGCRHVMMLVLGPDTKKGATIDRVAEQIDVAPTIGELMGFQTPLAAGKVLEDSLTHPLGLNRNEARTATARQAVELQKLADRPQVETIADAIIARRKPAEIPVNPDTEILMRGLLAAFDATGNTKYFDFASEWSQQAQPGKDQVAALSLAGVQLEIGRRSRLRAQLFPAAVEAAKQAMEIVGGQPDADQTPLLCGIAARIGRVTQNPQLCKEAANRLSAHIESLVSGGDAAWDETKDSLLVSGLAEVALANPDDKKLSATYLVHAARLLQRMPEIGGVWKDPGNSALNIYTFSQSIRLGWLQGMRNSARAKGLLLPEVLDTLTPAQKTALGIDDLTGKSVRKGRTARGNLFSLFMENGRRGLPFSLNLLRYQVDINKQFHADATDRGTGAYLLALASTQQGQTGRVKVRNRATPAQKNPNQPRNPNSQRKNPNARKNRAKPANPPAAQPPAIQ